MFANKCLVVILLVLSFSYAENSYADTIESLVMPGPVIEGHKKYEKTCKKCHSFFSKKKQDSLCRDCHKKVSKDISKKQGYHGKLKNITQCKNCHTEHKGRKVDIVKFNHYLFDHDNSDFKLRGEHKSVACSNCHKKNKKYREASTKCSVCHKKINPHKLKKLVHRDKLLSCRSCHSASSWGDMVFKHDKTRFKLRGKHEPVQCANCHPNDRYKKTPKNCYACHKYDDVHKKDKPKKGKKWKKGKKCQECHNSHGWRNLKFNHKKETKFPLVGKHKKLQCRDCHIKDPYKVKIKKTCYSCHKVDDKHNGRYDKKCSKCHKSSSWDKIKFKHDVDTKFKLKGKHKKTQCDECHTRNAYKYETSKECVSCHKKDDAHKNQLGKKCQRCHNVTSWQNKVVFDHDITKFPLLGLHSALTCEECHLKSTYKDVEANCNSCHEKDDVHKGKLGLQCQDCHNPNNWRVWDFNHTKQTNFKLDGKHKKLHCHDCHTIAVADIKNQLGACNDCHAVDDIHNGQFGRDCARCHSSKDFKKAKMR